jgi:lysozyme
MRKINDAGLNLIKLFESCRLNTYKDIVGINTIGFGHVGDVAFMGNVINQETADNLLFEDLERFESGVNHLVTSEINDNQFSALVSFAYNVGLGNLRSSHLLALVNSDNLEQAAGQFVRWDRAGGIEVSGLLRRREAERDLFIKEIV